MIILLLFLYNVFLLRTKIFTFFWYHRFHYVIKTERGQLFRITIQQLLWHLFLIFICIAINWLTFKCRIWKIRESFIACLTINFTNISLMLNQLYNAVTIKNLISNHAFYSLPMIFKIIKIITLHRRRAHHYC